ncbi:MAG: DUF5011 domain-containing protein [FCB group bacterium]|nr:DUF5011 domain-containing protein [FCB group bacterium]
MSLSNSSFINVSGWDFPSLYTGTWTNKTGLQLNNVNDSRFANNNMSGLFNGIYTQGTNSRDTLSNNNMSGNTGSGFASHVYTNNSNWIITGNDATNNSGAGIQYQGTPKEISGNDFTGSGTGLSLSNTNNFTLQPNTYNSVGTAVSLGNSHNNVIQGLESCGMAVGVNIGGVSNGNQILNSSFANATLYAIRIGQTSVQNTVIDGNVFYQNAIDVQDLGTNTVVTNSSQATSASWCPAPPNTVPVANAGADQSVVAVNGSASVTLDGAGSYDADSNVLTYSWSESGTQLATGLNPTVSLGWGFHQVVLTVNDGIDTATDTVNISVQQGLDPTLLTRTSWEKHSGLEAANGYPYGVVPFSSAGYQHGWEGEYTVATVPGASDAGWGPAPNGQTIGFYGEGAPGTSPSLIDDAGYGCQTAVDFTYFQTFVNIPANTTITQFTIDFNGMDDGSRITIYNASYPDGIVDPGSYVYLGGSGTADLSAYVTVGENRVVVTQVDDCPGGNTLAYAQVTLNGASVNFNVAPVANAGVDQSLATSIGTVDVTLDGSGSSDADGDVLTYTWSEGGTQLATGVNPTVSLAIGVHVIDLTVSDGTDTATDQVVVTVTGPYEQTFTIFGGNGNVGDIDPYTQASLDGGVTWQQAYLTGGHPWGFVNGTNSWVNFDPNNEVGINTRTPYRIRFTVPADFTNPSMVFTLKADNRALIWINDTFIDSVDGQGSPAVPDQIVAQSLHTGLNEIRIMLVDWGGIVGLNYRIDVTMTSAEDITNAVLTPAEAALLNNAPIANAGIDQTFDCVVGAATVVLDGSASSDPDGNILSYTWSENGASLATGANPTISLGGGAHTITLTVSDGELSATDEVVVTVSTDNDAPVITMNGDNPLQTICLYGYADPGVTVADNCDTNPVVTMTSTVDTSAVGSYSVTYTATDASGNSSSVTRTVDVINHDPVVTNAPAEVVLSYGEASLSADVDLSAIFSDPDGHSMTFSASLGDTDTVNMSFDSTIVSLSALDLGSATVTIGATDACGGSVTTQFAITVNVTPDLAGSVVFALQKAELKKETEVASGNLVVNQAYVDDDDSEDSDEENDDDHEDEDENHFELKLDKEVVTASGYFLKANTIQIKKDAQIGGDVYSNYLDNDGDILGSEYSPVSVPVFVNLPPFKTAPAGNDKITVDKNQTVILAPGDYGKVEVKDKGKLTLSGGEYHFKSLKLKKKARLRIENASQVLIVERLKAEKQSYIGPADGALIGPSSIIFYIAGEGGDEHNKVELGERSQIYATIYAPTSKIEVKKEAELMGALYGQEVKVDKKSGLALDSYFGGSGAGLAKLVVWTEPAIIEDPALPSSFALNQNYPNPFNPSTMISYDLAEKGQVRLTIYDLIGREVTTIVNDFKSPGRYTVEFDGSQLSTGTYLVVLTSKNEHQVRKMTLLK